MFKDPNNIIEYMQERNIALKSFTGHYISSESGTLYANKSRIGPHEIFRLIPLTWVGSNKYALLAENGHYVVADFDRGKGKLYANRTWIGPWETFTFHQFTWEGETKTAIQGANNQFVSADFDDGGVLISNRPGVGPWERFDIIYV